ncbi:MAG: DUF3368 domain-containing protein [Anaerolineae bacterium]
MIVVSNTSPLTNLAAIGQFALLGQLYETLYIPNAVWDELQAGGKRWPGYDQVASAHWIHRQVVQNKSLVAALQRDLDRGEAEAIALALEMNADLVLLDEREGRHAAQRLELEVVGVIGILIESKSKGRLVSVRPQLDELRQRAGFYVSERLYRSALALAGEESPTR